MILRDGPRKRFLGSKAILCARCNNKAIGHLLRAAQGESKLPLASSFFYNVGATEWVLEAGPRVVAWLRNNFVGLLLLIIFHLDLPEEQMRGEFATYAAMRPLPGAERSEHAEVARDFFLLWHAGVRDLGRNEGTRKATMHQFSQFLRVVIDARKTRVKVTRAGLAFHLGPAPAYLPDSIRARLLLLALLPNAQHVQRFLPNRLRLYFKGHGLVKRLSGTAIHPAVWQDLLTFLPTAEQLRALESSGGLAAAIDHGAVLGTL